MHAFKALSKKRNQTKFWQKQLQFEIIYYACFTVELYITQRQKMSYKSEWPTKAWKTLNITSSQSGGGTPHMKTGSFPSQIETKQCIEDRYSHSLSLSHSSSSLAACSFSCGSDLAGPTPPPYWTTSLNDNYQVLLGLGLVSHLLKIKNPHEIFLSLLLSFPLVHIRPLQSTRFILKTNFSTMNID